MVKRASQARAALARLQAAVDDLRVSCVVGVPDLRDGVLFDAVAILRPDHAAGPLRQDAPVPHREGAVHPGREALDGRDRRLAVRRARLLRARLSRGGTRPGPFGRAPADRAGRVRQRRASGSGRSATVSRALENGCYLAAAGHAGSNGATEFAGHSRVVDPSGELLADAGDRAEMLVVELRSRIVDEVRAGRPDSHACLADRRPELYGALTEPLAEPAREKPRR
jgi:hypothetical protein